MLRGMESYQDLYSSLIYSINRIMKQTSLQNIISRNHSALREAQLKEFFVERQYPHFEIQDLLNQSQLMEHPHFSMFMHVLEEWNRKASSRDKTLNQTEYRKNQFIFSRLKSIAVQNAKYVDSSLQQLRHWYLSNTQHELQCQLKKENTGRSRLEDWEIRNSYKSNMPLEIDNYHRRILFATTSHNQSPPSDSPLGSPQNNLSSVSSLDIIRAGCLKLGRKENNYLRGVREDRQFTDFQTSYKKSKANFYKKLPKDYYRKEFSKDKLDHNSPKQLTQTNSPFDYLKSYRIKTSMGFRPFDLSTSNSSFIQNSYSTFFRPKNSMKEQPKDLQHLNQSPEGRLNLSNIDGMRLFNNPYEVKLRKKKK